jgi:hypothetical protein
LNRDPATIVKGDDVMKYLLLANGHDGSLALRVGFTPIRVVCNNTLGMSIEGAERSKTTSRLLSIRHTDNAVSALKEVHEVINLANASFEATAEVYRRLARFDVTGDSLRKFLTIVFPQPKSTRKDLLEKVREAKAKRDSQPILEQIADATTGASLIGEIADATFGARALARDTIPVPSLDEIVTATEEDEDNRAIARVMDLFESSAPNQLPGVRGTLWAAYNAVTEYVSHSRGRSDENRVKALMHGDGSKINARALEAAQAMVRAA